MPLLTTESKLVLALQAHFKKYCTQPIGEFIDMEQSTSATNPQHTPTQPPPTKPHPTDKPHDPNKPAQPEHPGKEKEDDEKEEKDK